MKSRFRVLALRLAPLNYWMAPPLDFALNEGGVDPFFLFGSCALLGGTFARSLRRGLRGHCGESGEATSIWYRSDRDRFHVPVTARTAS